MLFNTFLFFIMSWYTIYAFGLVTFVLVKTYLVFFTLFGLNYSEGLKVSFSIVSLILGLMELLIIALCVLVNSLVIALVVISVILCLEVLYMIIYHKIKVPHGN